MIELRLKSIIKGHINRLYLEQICGLSPTVKTKYTTLIPSSYANIDRGNSIKKKKKKNGGHSALEWVSMCVRKSETKGTFSKGLVKRFLI